ncbi:hypothetical protein IFM89_006287 [Coptis chinensis]|uniref:Uncharacterized protein n=1 Tax=Coptis chinensis TaxID=261450 RepID=A0A835LD06_9MAGN|nr:hypothetical protein IFM89_006287 [Coptis chinensis]
MSTKGSKSFSFCKSPNAFPAQLRGKCSTREASLPEKALSKATLLRDRFVDIILKARRRLSIREFCSMVRKIFTYTREEQKMNQGTLNSRVDENPVIAEERTGDELKESDCKGQVDYVLPSPRKKLNPRVE